MLDLNRKKGRVRSEKDRVGKKNKKKKKKKKEKQKEKGLVVGMVLLSHLNELARL